MQAPDLDPLIQSLKEKPIPPAPAVEASVLQAIRHNITHQSKPAADWLELLLAPRVAAFCLLLVLLSSVGVTALTSNAHKAAADYTTVAAKAGTKSYLEAMKAAPHKGEAHREATDLSTPAKTIAEASNIKAVRSAFLKLSKAVTSLVQDVGPTGDTTLYLAKCPMAFNNKGGILMQSGKTIANSGFNLSRSALKLT